MIRGGRVALLGALLVIGELVAVPNAGEPVLTPATAGQSPPVTSPTASPGAGPAGRTPDLSADVVVYGATASGLIAAISAVKAGATALVLAPDENVGGMVTSGLSVADVGRRDLVGGLTREFYERIGRSYAPSGSHPAPAWRYEPSVAAAVFGTWLTEAGVTVRLGARLAPGGVTVADGRIVDLVLADGSIVAGKTYIDATYEGDLLAAAGVPYIVGREASTTYGESLAGVHLGRPTTIDGRDALGEVLPGVAPTPPAPDGTSDGLVQAATYRLCVTRDPKNRVPFPVPAGYDPAQFALVARAIESMADTGVKVSLRSLVSIVLLPHGKADLNSYGLVSLDRVGGDDSWASGDPTARETIAQEDFAWEAGFLHYLLTSPHVPARIRSELGPWGLCRDEFVATGNWPPLLYVREGRRMVSSEVLTQRDIQGTGIERDPIGIWAYRIDAHFADRVLDPTGHVVGDGQIGAPVTPYEIPLGILLPPPSAVTNLVVTAAVSASHVAYASLRMEPAFMIMGEAGGAIAALAALDGTPLRQVPYQRLRAILFARGGILAPPSLDPDGPGHTSR